MRLPAAVAVAALLALAACSDDQPANSEGAYCTTAKANADALTKPAIGTGTDIDATVALYDTMHTKAPLAIEPEWAAMEALVRAARDLDPNDQAAKDEFARQARETKDAADRVIIYTEQKCQVLIGDTPVQSVPLVPQSTEVDPSAVPNPTSSG